MKLKEIVEEIVEELKTLESKVEKDLLKEALRPGGDLFQKVLNKSKSKAKPLPKYSKKRDVNTQKYPELIAIEMFFDYIILFKDKKWDKKMMAAHDKVQKHWNEVIESKCADVEFVGRMTKIYRLLDHLMNYVNFRNEKYKEI